MSNPVVVELVKVTGVSPYSIFSGDIRYSFNKGVDSTMFQKGHTYSISVNVGKNGAKYINRVDGDLGILDLKGADTPESAAPLNPTVNQIPSSATPSVTPSTTSPAASKPVYKKSFNRGGYTKKDDGLSKEEWAAKDQRIKRSGLIQAAVGAVAGHVSSVEQLGVEAIKLAEVMETWVDKANSQSEQVPTSVSTPVQSA